MTTDVRANLAVVRSPERSYCGKSDGKPKQSGLQEGDMRTPHTLYFKLEVVKTYIRLQRLEKMGAVPSDPLAWRRA